MTASARRSTKGCYWKNARLQDGVRWSPASQEASLSGLLYLLNLDGGVRMRGDQCWESRRSPAYVRYVVAHPVLVSIEPSSEASTLH